MWVIAEEPPFVCGTAQEYNPYPVKVAFRDQIRTYCHESVATTILAQVGVSTRPALVRVTASSNATGKTEVEEQEEFFPIYVSLNPCMMGEGTVCLEMYEKIPIKMK